LYPLQQYFPPEITEKIKSLQESVEELSDDFSLFDTNGIRKFTIANNFINNNFVQKKKRKEKKTSSGRNFLKLHWTEFYTFMAQEREG